MTRLSSYVRGEWKTPDDAGQTLVNPSTEEPLAEASTKGIDFGAALAYARDTGGPALREMTFKQRGELLMRMSRAIHEKRDELIGVGMQNAGNTRGDAKFDVDGASSTLAWYAGLAAELGDAHLLVDGDAVQLGRGARLFGQHVRTSRRGVAVHVNAFNFPAWGIAEKAACALLAGMPIVAKPATSTALLAHRMSEVLVASADMPAGAYSFVCGSAGDMIDHLGHSDVLAFTGSSDTGATLRSHRAFVERGARINVEADSLNSAVLGPDVDASGETMNLFIRDVAREMTQKTGQKCTAFRRLYVPTDKVSAVVEQLGERLGAVKVGNPADDTVSMGPVATARQLEDLRAGVKKLEASAKIAFGSVAPLDGIGAPKGKGYFAGPVLLRCDAPDPNDAVHSHEVFGPVATVIAYDGTSAHAAALVAAGGGGLVASVYSDDRAFTREMVLGVAPHTGRVTLGSEKIAAQAIPPGMAMPTLLHGGPGRAGGGEELGGLRGMFLYMQRTALQGDRAVLEALAGKK